MKALKISVLTLGLIAAGYGIASAYSATDAAQQPAGQNTSEDCMVNISLFTEYAKVKDFAAALDPWEKVYAECPSASKNIYILGTNIVNWQISQTQDAAEREALVQKLMKLFDDRQKYYGKDAKVLAQKAYYYSVYKPNDKATVYNWLKEAITSLGTKTDPSYLQQFIYTSNDLYKADNTLAEQFINDYTMTNEILTTNSTNTALRNVETYKTLKQNVDVLFAASGVADCDKMNEVFLPNIENNQTNQSYLEGTIRLFKSVKCTESEAYFKAAEYAHRISPSAESATALGKMSYAKENYNNAINYYEEAVKMCTEDVDIAENQFLIAMTYFKMGQNEKVREYCKQSLAANASQGAPHILLGTIYASAKVSDDPTLAKAAFWAAVDQFVKAKNAEPDNAAIVEQANKLIRTYSAYFPAKEEVFMHPEIEEGKSYYVGGLVRETTTVRSK